jgi:hypothetical protein
MPNPGSTSARGYGHTHRAERARWKPTVDAGDAHCTATTCLDPDGTGRWIMPGRPWDLGHTADRSGYTGPEHMSCNRTDGAVRRNATRTPNPTGPGLPTTEDWWG